MVRASFLSLVTLAVAAAGAPAQSGSWQLRWQPGQVLTYRVEHVTSACDVSGDSKSESKTRLGLSKRWQVLGVDPAGVATVQLALTALRLETVTPSGETLLFDSGAPDKGDPHLRDELARFVGRPLAVLRVDGRGRVVEVKESKYGPASRFENELPFACVLPGEGPRAGQTWERAYKVTLEPPHGTGEKYDAVQQYTCKAVTDGAATVAVRTVFKTLPSSPLDRVPLLQMQPEGEAVFDTGAGRLRSVRFHIDQELTSYQGEGTSYQFHSTYQEDYVPDR